MTPIGRWSSCDPLKTVWDALDQADCRPHGRPYDFRACCPAHDGDNDSSLHVAVGADGRALLHCFAHECSVEDVVAVIGLEMFDLFPPGHRRARPRDLKEARRGDFEGTAREFVNILAGLEIVGAEWFVQLRCDCPHCGSPASLLFVGSNGLLTVKCPVDGYAEADGFTACTLRQFKHALAARIGDRRAA